MFNTDLAILILKRIEAEPETWNQMWWATKTRSERNGCGTAYCFAGHVAVEAGYQPFFHQGTHTSSFARNVEYGIRHIQQIAIDALGLTFGDSVDLFKPSNDLDTLKHLVKTFALRYNGEEIDV